jgi:type IV secretion system protein VirB10
MSESAGIERDPRDIRPVVALHSASNWGMWVFLAVLLTGGTMLFNALSAGREAAQAPATFAHTARAGQTIASPPPLGLPSRFLDAADTPDQRALNEAGAQTPPAASYTPIPLLRRAPPVYAPPTYSPQEFEPRADAEAQPRVVYETRGPEASAQPAPPGGADKDRVTAGRFANPSLTIPKGTVIPAVLETALDSTRPGAVRALVQRDIHGFDGTRVLIQRGTRLYGEYEADLASGQNRAMITWTRLLRPDGVTMNLDSPASDPLGRAGVKGKVDSKFFERFGGAILQSVLDIGVGIATREATNGVIVALPGSTQNLTQIAQPGEIRPTLKVRHGASVSVFVARDLDFSTVD